MRMGALYNDYKGKILHEWRQVRAQHPDGGDILALLYVEDEVVTLSLLDRGFALQELGITDVRNQLTRPANEADPPVPLALWVLLVHDKVNETRRLEDVMSLGGVA